MQGITLTQQFNCDLSQSDADRCALYFLVILGASFGGLSAAHYLAKHVLPQLQKAKDVKYELHLVDQSTHFWWHIGAPRAIVSVKEMKHSDTFFPIMDGFKQYSNLKDSIHFHHGSIAGLDTETRQVSINPAAGGEVEKLDYYALIIATGIRSTTPLTTFQGDYTVSQRALEEMNAKLTTAKTIVVGGGGPIAVETAGELATHLKGKAKITVVAGGTKLLPILRESLSQKAQKQLEKNGVSVRYGVKVQNSKVTSDGKTEVILENGETLSADVYIPAVGVTPNTEFLPTVLKGTNGYIKTNPHTLRVDEAGTRVYAVGDVAGVDKGGVLNFFNSFPVAAANISHDLLTDAKVGNVAEKKYQRKDAESQLVPVGAKTGVGAFNGFKMPGFAVSQIKGKDYMVKTIPDWTEGKKWQKA